MLICLSDGLILTVWPLHIITFIIVGMEHWESLYTFFNLWRNRIGEGRCRAIVYQAGALICFPVLSVAVAWFSWPHLIGTEVSQFRNVCFTNVVLVKIS